jgi:hypothetical protein
LTGIYFWGSKTVKKRIPEDFFFFPVFSGGIFHRNVVLEGVSGISVFAAFTGIFCRNSCGTGIPAFTMVPPDSSGFLRIPVPAKGCLALACN